MSTLAVIGASAVTLVGMAIAGLGLASLRQWYQLHSREPDRAHQVTEGPTELAGTAQPLESAGTVRSGLTGEECLLYEYVVEEFQQGQHGGSWSEVTAGSGGVNFVVGDETGRVVVDPEGATTVLDREFSEQIEGGSEPSAAVSSFLERSDVDHESRTFDIGVTELSLGDRHRFRESRIHPGESVYVSGIADRQVSDYDVGFGGPDAVIRADGSRGRFRKYLDYPFVVSDYSESTAQRELLERSLKILGIGSAVFLAAGYVLLAQFV